MIDRIRDREEIQRAHDLLAHVVLDDGLAEGLGPEVVERLSRCLDVLCWTLRHDHNHTFGGMIADIERAMNEAGVALVRSDEMVYPEEPEGAA